MKIDLIIDEQTLAQIKQHHNSSSSETMAFAFAGLRKYGKKIRIFVQPQSVILPAEDCYIYAAKARVKLNKTVQATIYNELIQSNSRVLINSHSHPFSESGTDFSLKDDKDDIVQAEYWQSMPMTNGQARFSLSLVFDQSSISARLTHKGKFYPINRVQVLRPAQVDTFVPNNAIDKAKVFVSNNMFSRQQAIINESNIANYKVGVVGAGGLGSIIAESLVRLGVKKFTIIDDDIVERSNLNRLQGCTEHDLYEYKVKVIERNIENITGQVECHAITANLRSQTAITSLSSCDVIIGCVDNDVARYEINRLATQYMIPFFDVATSVTINEGESNYLGRIFSSIPSQTSCMECFSKPILKFDEIIQATLSPAMLDNFRHRGYIAGDRKVEKAISIYGLNQIAVGLMSLELVRFFNQQPLNRITVFNNEGNKLTRLKAPDFFDPPAVHCPNCSLHLAVGTQLSLPVIKQPFANTKAKEWLEL